MSTHYRHAGEYLERLLQSRLDEVGLLFNESNHVYLDFQFTTGDAAGQNMVTIATQAILDYIQASSLVPPQYSSVEANLSGDKKASAQSLLSVRGKKVTAEVTLPANLIQKRSHTTPEQMVNYWRMSAIADILTGTFGIQGHYANGLAVLYIACGQDAACVAESAVGITCFEVTDTGSLYAAVTVPSLMIRLCGRWHKFAQPAGVFRNFRASWSG